MNWLVIGILSRYLSELSVRNKKDAKDRTSKTSDWGVFREREKKVSNSGKTMDLKDVECFKSHTKQMPGCKEQRWKGILQGATA